jgi:hypothetical protein
MGDCKRVEFERFILGSAQLILKFRWAMAALIWRSSYKIGSYSACNDLKSISS